MILKFLDNIAEKIFEQASNVRPKVVVEAKVYRACTKCGHSGIVNNK